MMGSTLPGKPYNQAPSHHLSLFCNVADPLHRVQITFLLEKHTDYQRKVRWKGAESWLNC